jgi:low affinity Fe/Cu permease
MERFFARFATATAHATGSPTAFLCVAALVICVISGPFLQLVINTGTTIITFLMIFLIQNTQNRDGALLQANSTSYPVIGR